MSSQSLRKAALAALTGTGAVVLLRAALKPSRTQGIASGIRNDLDQYNSQVQPEQDPHATMLDRTKLMEDVKAKKPWNKTYSEHERV